MAHLVILNALSIILHYIEFDGDQLIKSYELNKTNDILKTTLKKFQHEGC